MRVGGAIERVRRLALVTAGHTGTRTRDEAVLVDIDLAILGAEPAVYARFETDVREEYARVPAFLYRRKRAEVLEGFLARPGLYPSGIFGSERERRARESLTHAIDALRGR